MLLSNLQDLGLLQKSSLHRFEKMVKQGLTLVIEDLWETPKAILSSLSASQTHKHLLLITSGIEESRFFADFSLLYSGKVVEFPAWETLPSEEVAPSSDIVGERYRILNEILEAKEPLIIISSLQGVLQKLITPKLLDKLNLELKLGDDLSFESLPEKLIEMGYNRAPIATDKGEFAIRGGILDIFPVSRSEPVRIEFWDNEITSIRTFDPIAQTSLSKIDFIHITPAQELELIKKEHNQVTLFDYLGDNTLVVLDNLEALEDRYIALKEMGAFFRSFCTIEEFFERVSTLQKIYFVEHALEDLSDVKREANSQLSFSFFNLTLTAQRFSHSFIPLLPAFCPDIENPQGSDLLLALKPLCDEEEVELIIVTSTESEESYLKKQLNDLEVRLPQKTQWIRGYLTSGFFLKEIDLIVLPMTEITRRYKIHRQKQRQFTHVVPYETQKINPGDVVVHVNNGLGKYLGVEKRVNNLGIETEFLLLEYADQAKLYVPLHQSNLVSKYIGANDSTPKLNPLGSKRWQNAREKTQIAIMGYAEELLKLQAERALRGGYIYPPNSEEVKKFAEEFPYVETADQLQAIEKIHEDLTTDKALDRLICGDVGYGKTEVAMRAAFKVAVDGGKQVAVLVPTTVLATQHYETFCERMRHFPLNIGLLSRFRTAKQIKETLEGLEKGSVDIVVGTHRMISEDVKFKNLGLLIIDEEQRFGVKAKEHLKQLKRDVDCLTLSATPIPRTLYFSLIGARDMSVINTPPQDRLPIKTIICQSDQHVIKNAILREHARDGQVYFIHNRVETIFEMASRIQKLLPDARIVVGHGQMSSNELDEVFHAFKSGKANVLVATSIIENGIDIPNANTILVDRADRFGLGDLYQIRGRVGRWNRKAYCYFLVPSQRELSEIARKRLIALAEASGHGGGMKIAMHDLEMRGAGNILGTEQSGHVEVIGFHLYCKLLKKAVNSLKNKTRPKFYSDIKVEFPFDARLPDDYINEMTLRMEIYQRLGDAEQESDVEEIYKELQDRFGPPPLSVQWLYYTTRIKIFAERNHFTLLRLTKMLFEVHQRHGKTSLIKKIMLPLPKTPQELEKKIIEALKTNFPIKS